MVNRIIAKLNHLSDIDLDRLMQYCKIGIKDVRNKPLDRETKILILSYENEKKLRKAFKDLGIVIKTEKRISKSKKTRKTKKQKSKK